MPNLFRITCIFLFSIIFANIAQSATDPSTVLTLDWSPDGAYIAVGRTNGAIELWNIATNTLAHHFIGHTQEIQVLKYSPDGQQIASGSPDGTIRIWSVDTGELINLIQFSPPTGGMRALLDLDWNFDGTLIAAARDNDYIFIWDAQTGEQITAYPHTDLPLSVDWHPSANILVSSGIGEDILRWDPDSKIPHIFYQNLNNMGSIADIAWSPTGEQIAISTYRYGTQIFNYPSMTLTLQIETPPNTPLSLYWNPNGTQLAIGMVDHIMIVSSTTGIAEEILTGNGIGNSVAWSPHGGRLAIRELADGFIYITAPNSSLEQL